MFSAQDTDLVYEVQNGNRTAYTKLVKKYEKLLFRLIVRFVKDEELARDVMQEAFLKTYMSLARFEHKCSFKNWLYKIALNTARNKLRSLRESENIEDVVILDVCLIEANMLRQEILEKLRSVVDTLPEKQKQALELRVYQDLSFKEVSVLMNCPYDTAKANYRHAMLKLKEHFARGR
ncbi:sigma-70 family RNA polymerase sigma factor [bacterium]|nr:sigma-70 family RNA polymerase sigma factor [bacterium]